MSIFDINAVPVNFGKTHPGTAGAPLPTPVEPQVVALGKESGVTSPPIAAKGPQQVDKNQEFWVDIEVGALGNPVTNLKVVSFELTYTNTAIVDYLSYEVGPFLTGAIATVIPDDPNGKVSASVYRTTGSNSGYGVVLRLKFRTSAQAAAGQTVSFAFAQVLANREDGSVQPLSPIGQVVTIQPGSGIRADDFTPTEFELVQNYPNPFNPGTVIEYRLPQASRVTLQVYNLAGVKVASLRDGMESAGRHSVVWDGRDEMGRPVAAGVYMCRLVAGTYDKTIRMLLLR
ncbi:MAG: FlgD immunoglobulin-like domain containing protein [bacterium]|nr:T9SS type A sorting domain-containing protein [candidate division KSB1 bacterium]MDH7559088.1 FlgD immunoglobulin-like domain containing protein [bacterium]